MAEVGPSSMTHEQNEQIFKIMRRKAMEERTAAAKKAELELELMRKESDARIAASTTAATAAAAATVAVAAP